MGENRRENAISTFLFSSWERRRVNLIFSLDLAGDMKILYEIIPISVCDPKPFLHSEVLNIFTM